MTSPRFVNTNLGQWSATSTFAAVIKKFLITENAGGRKGWREVERDEVERDKVELDKVELDKVERDKVERDKVERDKVERDKVERDD
jgi:hypothetical protein